MKNYFFVFIALVVVATGTSCQNTANVKTISIKTSQDSLSYALGVNIGQSMKQQNLTDINADMMANVIDAILKGDTALTMNNEQAMTFINGYMTNKRKIDADKAVEEGKHYHEEKGKQAGVTTTASGLQYEIIKSGTGATPTGDDQVTVHYTGKLTDGTVFDSSVERGEPITFPVSGVIKGWTEALLLMKEGDKWMLYIPSELAYGQAGAGGVIPPNASLTFEVELLKVVPGTGAPQDSLINE
jgi:FKBP-type peptidyl-prolyl cis-trans isomerase FklB